VKSVLAEHLVKTYKKGHVRALNDLSLDVEEGTVLSVLGPNGAGKTTVVRILATLLAPDSGSATVGTPPGESSRNHWTFGPVRRSR
jgi:ABC-2 type transport system ATP-binding protein